MTSETRATADRRIAAAPWILVAVLVAASVATGSAVVGALGGVAEAFISPPPLASTEWLQRILRYSSRQLAFGVATVALVTAAGASAVIAVAAAALRRGARAAPGGWTAVPGVVGALLVAASLPLARGQSVASSAAQVGVPGLLSADARGIPSVAVALGSAGMLVLAAVAGLVAASSRWALVGCAVVAAALTLGTLAAVTLAAAPIDALIRAPSYPAQAIAPDPFAASLAPILGLGAGAFGVAGLAAGAVRARHHPSRPGKRADPPPFL